ncbi:enoyl-CoA hydratase [Cupriavidus sp. TA19]|uniref:enoyl-CoA hydratase/isomerase family protein n=1 Tax=Cupriavidus sp. TA19 TaxID=701108 RepID=UPI00272945D7|nr:enoyl-CoA hydratase/isomerase family protein [Cupriavidus sp. TA19]GLC91799.1 enoyl-CoA hydratase [Cupriavidus sp. TA19]
MNTLQLDLNSHIWRVTLDRPQHGNALSAQLVTELDEVLARAERDLPAAVILAGSGRHFCTGFDLSDLAEESDDTLLARFVRIELLLQRIARAPYLTVAIARGRAMGAGADVFAACRLRLAEGNASFAFPGASGFGLVLGTRRLAALVGSSTALNWIETGRGVPAAEAQRAGLVSAFLPNEQSIAEEVSQQLNMPTHMAAALRSAIEPEAGMNDAKDLERLVRSAALPGLRDRISTYVQRAMAARLTVTD